MAYTKKPTVEHIHEPKRRKCLRCHAPFISEWPGERVCGKCKASNAWRQGMPWSPGVKVKIERKEGHGTTVSLHLPKAEPMDEHARRKEKDEATST